MITLERLLLLGATGAVGQQVLRLALADPAIGRVIAPTRRALPAQAKLENPVVDFDHIAADAPWLKADALICTLGTTIKIAGSQAAFAAVDRDLPIRLARLARAAGARRFALNSSLGASAGGNFYLRTKFETEEGIRSLAYPTYAIVRPSLIDALRAKPRRGERLGLIIARLGRVLIPRRYRAVKAERVAQALLAAVRRDAAGETIVESDQLQEP